MKLVSKHVQPSKQFALILVVFILVIISMAIIFHFRVNKSVEKFANETLMLEELNIYKNMRSCPRKIAFTNFVTQTYNASERSITDISSKTGDCPIRASGGAVTPELSEVEENKIPYSIKSICIKLKYEIFDRDDSNNESLVSLYLVNDGTQIDNSINLLYFFLVNPIYVEFEGSTAYVPEYDDTKGIDPSYYTTSFYTNFNSGPILKNKSTNRIPFALRRLIPYNSSSKNATFDYTDKSLPLKQTVLNRMNSSVNARVYFLESQLVQTTGLYRSLDQVYKRDSEIGVMKIYNKNYQVDIKPTVDEYYFHQKMYVLLQNSLQPIMTFKFELCVPVERYEKLVNKSTEVFKVYIDTNLGKYTDCPHFKTIDVNNNNILSASVSTKQWLNKQDQENISVKQAMSRDKSVANKPECNLEKKKFVLQQSDKYDVTYLLKFTTSNNKDNKSCSFENEGELLIELPFASTNERISVVVTVSPYEKIALCKWNANGQEYFTFKRTPKCQSNNNFFNVINQRSLNKEIINENINLAYDTSYIANINYVQLGHKNYLKDYYAKM